jgi:hypothetical protein
MPERPRLFLVTKEKAGATYEDVLIVEISPDAKGLSFFSLAVDPDPNARYEMHISNIYDCEDLELTAMWAVVFEHLTSGTYEGFKATDKIIIRHRSTDPNTTVKSCVTCAMSEVIAERCR